MTPRTRHTFNVNTDMIGDFARFRKTLRAWQSSSVLCMGDKHAPNTQARMLCDDVRSWGGFGIYRPYENSEGHLWRERTPKAHVDWLKSFGQNWWWWNVGNEPIPGGAEVAKMDTWYAEFIDRSVEANLRVVIPGGFATGSFELSQIERGDFDRMLRKIGDYAMERVDGYSRVMVGAHTYAHALIPWHTAGRNPNDLTKPERIERAKWPTQAEIFDGDESDNWLVLRENWLVNRIQTLMGKPTRVDVAITECFLDRMPNIEIQFRDVTATIDSLAGQRVYGIPTLWNYWRAMFPLWTPEKTLCEQMQWCEDVYPTRDDQFPGDYVTFAWFTWSQHSDWHDHYDPSDNVAWLDMVPEQVHTPKPPGPRPPVVPEPEPPVIVKPAPDAEPPPNDEDTTEIERPDRLTLARKRVEILQREQERLHAERALNSKQVALYQLKNEIVDLRSQIIMAELLLAEKEVEDLSEAANAA